MPLSNIPSLYGLSENNSSRDGADLWGKNQFNSTFPLSLCLYMRDNGIAPVTVDARDGTVKARKNSGWQMEEIFGRDIDAFYYDFESAFAQYDSLTFGGGDRIDLVVRHKVNGPERNALEIKLTVVPDSGTAQKMEDEWAPEMVIRPVTSAYAMMNLAVMLQGELKSEACRILATAYKPINDWDNKGDIESNAQNLRKAIDEILILAENVQRPFLLQPIWKTKGQSFELAEQCFDVFIWSDVSLLRLPLSEYEGGKASQPIRLLRETARHVRALYDILTTGDYNYNQIYKGMALGAQTDKSFAVNGSNTYKYLRHERLNKPALPRDVLHQIILNGGEHELKPERRFDAAVLNYHLTNQNK